MPDGRYQEITFSPDLRRAAVVRFATRTESDIWIADVDRGGATRFTSAPGYNMTSSGPPMAAGSCLPAIATGRATSS